ncbi:methylated-DNA--[protein]-cysteine S-methyltransferase [Halomarina litorea]|uniref:methylated-DNA--[protein]-cysteine S-methyltransferase n=1 Tax=Halomarina litorea TaxID=2961595 RepID=UPI0020C30FA2|nr:MGMT family protein [Halomarina sp. BCD28]
MDDAGIYTRESEYLDCYVQLGLASDRVLAVSFPEESDDEDADHALLDRIDAYLEGEREEFDDVAVALTVPTDQREVLETTREVPYGEQVSVERLTRMTPGLDASSDEDHDAVRTALAANPAPLVIPDHRVRDGPSGAPPEIEQRLRALEGL